MKYAQATIAKAIPGTRWFWWPLIVILLMSSGWALASPISSVPDEPAHIVKAAAVVRGQLLGAQVGDGGPLLAVDVPRYISHTNEITCFVRRLEQTPSCSPPVPGDPAETVIGVTTAGLYNPVYYAAVGWPTLLLTGYDAIYAMRLVSALLTSVFLALAFWALSRLPHRKWAILTLSVAVTPMTLFLNGSVNPNSLEYGTTAAIAANLLLLTRYSDGDRLPFLPIGVITVAAALLANTKALSLAWLFVTVVAVFILATSEQLKKVIGSRRVWTGAALIGASCAFALWWVMKNGSLSSKPFEGAGLEFGDGAEIMIDKTFLFMEGYIGQFGWLELNAPSGVMTLWTAMFFAAVLGGIIYGRGRHRIAVIVLAASLIVLPVILQASVITEQGLVWQGRYILALFVPCLMFAGIALDAADKGLWQVKAKPALVTILVLAAVGQLITFVWVLRRYVTGLGLEVRWVEMLEDPQWQPFVVGMWPPVVIFAAGTILAAVLLLRHVADNVEKSEAGEAKWRMLVPAAGADSTPGQLIPSSSARPAGGEALQPEHLKSGSA